MSPTILTDKIEATRLADALQDLLILGGVHTDAAGQQAVQMLRRWPDGEPAAWRAEIRSVKYLAGEMQLLGIGRDQVPQHMESGLVVEVRVVGTAPERSAEATAQPAESERIAERKWLDNECLDGGCQSLKWHERIAALEAALAEHDRVIEQARGAMERSLSWLTSYPGDGTLSPGGPYQQMRAALRAIEELKR